MLLCLIGNVRVIPSRRSDDDYEYTAKGMYDRIAYLLKQNPLENLMPYLIYFSLNK